MKILNLTQHKATPEQALDGVVEPKKKREIQKLLTFDEIPSPEEIQERVDKLVKIAKKEGCTHAMIGGAPFMMFQLQVTLEMEGINAVYSFSKRVSKEVKKDNKVEKISVFEHIGFVFFDTGEVDDECEECKIKLNEIVA